MDSNLVEIDEDFRERLAGHSIRNMKLKKLDKLLEGHKQHVLQTYISWLKEGFIIETGAQSDPTKHSSRTAKLQSWCHRLQNHGFDPDRIFDTLHECTPQMVGASATNRFQFERIKKDIWLLLSCPRSKGKGKISQAPVTDYDSPPPRRYTNGPAKKINDNEANRKDTMQSKKTDIDSIQKREQMEILADTASEMEASQGARHQQSHPFGYSVPIDESAPNVRALGPTEDMLYGPKQQRHIHHGGEPKSPSFTGITTHRLDPHWETTSKQLSHVRQTNKNNSIWDASLYDDSDGAVYRVERQVHGTPAADTKRRQEAVAQGEAPRDDRHSRIYALEVPSRKAERLAGGARHGKRILNQIMRVEKPHNEYVCYRCEVPGHFLQDCPTNLDPSFDRAPTGGYKCMICGKTKAHLTSLCPENNDPTSLTQLRLKFGIQPTRKLHESSLYRPFYTKKEADRQKERGHISDSLDDGIMNEDRRRAVLKLAKDGDDKLMNQDSFESRCMRTKRPYFREQLSQDDQTIDRHNSPPPKRFRNDAQKKVPISERERAHDLQSGEKSSDFFVDGSELLANLDRSRAQRGRLSYWDGGYQTPPAPKQNSPIQYQDVPSSSSSIHTKKQSTAQEFWSGCKRVEEINYLFPDADPEWIKDMACFDMDNFFEGMHDLIRSAASTSQAMTADMDTFSEQSEETRYKTLSCASLGEHCEPEGLRNC